VANESSALGTDPAFLAHLTFGYTLYHRNLTYLPYQPCICNNVSTLT